MNTYPVAGLEVLPFKTQALYVHMAMGLMIYDNMYMESHPRQFFHCLGCAVLLCLVCLFDLACFFLSSFSSLI